LFFCLLLCLQCSSFRYQSFSSISLSLNSLKSLKTNNNQHLSHSHGFSASSFQRCSHTVPSFAYSNSRLYSKGKGNSDSTTKTNGKKKKEEDKQEVLEGSEVGNEGEEVNEQKEGEEANESDRGSERGTENEEQAKDRESKDNEKEDEGGREYYNKVSLRQKMNHWFLPISEYFFKPYSNNIYEVTLGNLLGMTVLNMIIFYSAHRLLLSPTFRYSLISLCDTLYFCFMYIWLRYDDKDIDTFLGIQENYFELETDMRKEENRKKYESPIADFLALYSA
jgi:hypothetical protein